jgi:hypothetical protein
LTDNKLSSVPVAVEDPKNESESWRERMKILSPIARKERGRVVAEEVQAEKEKRAREAEIVGRGLTRFRSVAARINYISQDRPDLKIAAAKVCKTMSAPRMKDWLLVERIAKYLKAKPSVACLYEWQQWCETIDAYSDSDWAGDRLSRRSMSGGCLMRGKHMIKCWAKSQHVIALSSGEAELYACTRASSESIGLRSAMSDMGMNAKIKVHVDANAAIGMIMKEGLSGVRHIDTQYLWAQEAVRDGRLKVVKVDGKLNPADLFTKPLSSATISGHMHRIGFGC